MKKKLLKELFSESWCKETCWPELRDGWTEENPSYGQGAVTALIINDCLGGKIVRCMVHYGEHYYNRIDGKIVDLTADQFQGKPTSYEQEEEITREHLLGNEDTRKRYRELLGRVRSTIIDKNIDIMWTNEDLNKYKAFLNHYYLFTDYEIMDYQKEEDFEYTKFELAAQNTGWIMKAKHNLQTDEYTCDVNRSTFPIPDEFLRTIFDVARQYQDNISLENVLTDAYVKANGLR